jgi:hypothetical protein
MMGSEVLALLDLIGNNVDNSVMYLDQDKLLVSLDMLVTVTEFIH